MKLDKDLVREILLAIESSDQTPDSWIDLTFESRSKDEASYHVMPLHEAGFIVAQDLCSISDFDWRPKRLTIRGHEFLDTIRDREVWRLTKASAEKAGGVSQPVMPRNRQSIRQASSQGSSGRSISREQPFPHEFARSTCPKVIELSKYEGQLAPS